MHVFRIILKDKNPQGGNNCYDLPCPPETSLVQFALSTKAQSGVVNEAVAIPFENILLVFRAEVDDVEAGIHAPAMGSA